MNQSRSLTVRILTVVVLAGAAAGAGYVFRGMAGDKTAQGGNHLPLTQDQVVACVGYIDVEQGITPLSPVQVGRVEKVLARENDAVSAGAVLLHLEDHQCRSRLEEAEKALAGAKIQLEQARLSVLQHDKKIEQQQAAADAARHRLGASRQMLQRKQELKRLLQLSEFELAAAQEQAQELAAMEKGERERLAELKQHDPQLDVRKAETDVQAMEARLKQAKQNLDECDLKAPRDGVVLRIQVGPGDVLGPGMSRNPAILFCPKERRVVRAEVEQEFAGRVAVGQLAWIEDDSHPAEHWSGKVIRLSDWFTHRRSGALEPAQFQDVRTVECVLSLDSDQPPPRIGQRVRVMIGKKDEAP